MRILDSVRVVIYRFHEKGLEILLINNEMKNAPEIWKVPQANISTPLNSEFIELENLSSDQGEHIKTLAIEADWHEIPSIRGMIKHDVKLVGSKLLSSLEDFEKGCYFQIKDAFKKVLPNEYQALKEIKDIILDRNLIRNI